MAKRTREVTLIVNTKGQIEAIKGFEKLNDTIHKTEKNAGAVDRELKATAQATSNTTKVFAKQAQGLGGLVHVYATVAAHVFALSSAYYVLKRNADLKILETSAKTLSDATGINYLRVAENIKSITNNAISLKDAMQTTNLALSGGLDTSQLERLTAVATKAAAATGRSVPESVQRMVQAVVKGEPELVDEFGIILRIGKATADYAKEHHKAANALTTFERQQAIAIQALERGEKAYKAIKLEDIANPYDQLSASLTDLSNSIVSFVSGPISSLAKYFAESKVGLYSLVALIIGGVGKKALPVFEEFNNSLEKFAAEATKKAGASIDRLSNKYEELERSSGHFLKTQARINSELPKIIARTNLGDRTEIKKAIAKGATGKELNSALVKTMKRSGRDALITLLGEMESQAKKNKFDFLGTVITRGEARTILSSILKEEELAFSASLNKRLAAYKEFSTTRLTQTKLNTEKWLVSIKARAAAYKSIMSSAFAAGSKAEDLALAKSAGKDIGALGGKAIEGVLDTTKYAKTAKTLGSISGVFGRIVGFASRILGFLTGWGVAISIASAFALPIAEAIGIWDSKLAEAVDKANEFADHISEVYDAITKNNEKLVEGNLTLQDRLAILKSQVDVFDRIAKSIEAVGTAATKSNQMNWFEYLINGQSTGDFVEKLTAHIKALKANAESVGKPLKNIQTFSKVMQQKIDKLFGDQIYGYSTVPTEFSATINITNTETISQSIADTIRKGFRRGIALVDIKKAIVEKFRSIAKDKGLEVKNILDTTTALDQQFKSLNTILSKAKGVSSPYADILNSLRGMTLEANNLAKIDGFDAVLQSLNSGREISAEIDSLFSKWGVSISDGEKALSTLNKKFKELSKKQAAYVTAVEDQKLAEKKLALLKVEQKDNINAIFEAEKKIQEAKINAVQQDINAYTLAKNLRTEDNKSKAIYQAKLRAAKERLKVEQAILKTKFGDNVLELRKVNQELKNNAFALSYVENAYTRLKAVQKGTITQSDRLGTGTASAVEAYSKLIKLETEESKSRINLLKQREASLKKAVANSADNETKQNNTLKLQETQLQITQEQYNLEALIYDLKKKQHEELVKSTDIKSPNFVKGLQDELRYQIIEFDKTRSRWIKTVSKLLVDPIVSAMDTMTQGFIDGTKPITEVFKDSFKSFFDSSVDIIMKQLNDNFKRSLLEFWNSSPELTKLFGTFGGDNKQLVLAEESNAFLQSIATTNTVIANALTGGAIGYGGLGSIGGTSSSIFQSALGAVGSALTPSMLFNGKTIDLSSKLAFSATNPNITAPLAFPSTAVTAASSSAGFLSSVGDFFGSIGSALSSIWPFAKGGIVDIPGYAKGAYATKPQLAMIGEGKNNEAIVPLPDNRSIPVDLKGQGGTTNVNNININVTVENNGLANTDISGDAGNARALGSMISNVVKETIINESRPGGLLTRSR